MHLFHNKLALRTDLNFLPSKSNIDLVLILEII